VLGRNIDKGKIEMRVGMKHVFAHAFEKLYIAIWSCVKLEDVLEVLPMLIPNMFVD
jgi:hypothetical protein